MFQSPFKRTPSNMDALINDICVRMQFLDPEDPKYSELLTQLERLEKLKNEAHSWRPSPDALCTAGSSLFGILFIVAYEQKHVFTSKAFEIIKKIR